MGAGVLGLTGLSGFVFYVMCSACLSALLYGKYRNAQSLHEGVVGNVLSFVLFWTLFYGLVHVYE